MNRLTEVGFEWVGAWELGPNGPELKLERMGDAAPALYAFVVNGEVMYVGKTARPLRRRLYGYVCPGASQRTNVRLRRAILDTLREGRSVEILGFAEGRDHRVGQFRISLPGALEDDIIRQLEPPWNGGDVRERTDQKAGRTDAQIPGLCSTPKQPTRSTGASRVSQAQPMFTVLIGKTYYRQGFFNVPVAYARYFAGHGATIRVFARNRPTPVNGRINRTVNRNDTPRIMGGTALRDWLHDNVGLNGRLQVQVNGPADIEIRPG